MICETCEGEGFIKGYTPEGGFVAVPCPECLGGIASCCEGAPTVIPDHESAVCFACGALQPFGRMRCGQCGKPLVFEASR